MAINAEDLIQKAKVQLVLHHPFFASTVFKRPLTIRDEEGFTACIDLAGNITIGHKFVESLSVQQ